MGHFKLIGFWRGAAGLAQQANLDSSSQLMYRLGHQAIFAAVGIAGGAFALVLEGRGELERAGWGWWTARVCGALMVWSWWSSRGLLRRKSK